MTATDAASTSVFDFFSFLFLTKLCLSQALHLQAVLALTFSADLALQFFFA